MTTAEKLACVEREVRMRERVYPRWVEQGRMSRDTATREIATMQAIADDYRKMVEKERLL